MSDKQKTDESSLQEEAIQKDTSEEIISNVNKADNNSDDEVDQLSALDTDELMARIKEAQEKAEKNWDVALRTKAEMENVRRRTEKEVSNARKFGLEKMINEILPVKDSMEMGLKAAVDMDIEDESVHKIREGMELTLKMLGDALTKIGITEVPSEEGDTFNAEFHQAMSLQEIPGKESNSIIAVMQKGYLLNERLIRPAMVMVAK